MRRRRASAVRFRARALVKTIARLSDLHLGRSPATALACSRIVRALVVERVDQVLVTGDVTDHGRVDELGHFRRLFAPLSGPLLVVPGNHDRLGEDAGRWIQRGRLHAQHLPGTFVIRLDSTAPHNSSAIAAHGLLNPRDIDEVKVVLDAAPEGSLVALMLRHHVHALPEDGLLERFSTLVGWPNASHLPLGGALLERLAGR